ncbi:MAG TPA: EamA family transporter [Candidatus Nanoarchaeia archaeon]|nr:EamA family transporter [Candidatus Nanoarchaeia archaeon]
MSISKVKEKGKTKTIILVLVSVLIISTAQVLMKNGMNMITLDGLSSLLNLYNLIKIISNPYVLGGLIMYSLALVLWLGAMSRADVSFIYPLLSTGYILTTIFAIVFLSEQVSLFRWIGIGFIFAGTFFIGKS